MVQHHLQDIQPDQLKDIDRFLKSLVSFQTKS